MHTLAQDEKSTLVMIYTHTMMIRGEVVTKDNVRVSTWLRTDAAPRFIHLLKASVLVFGGSPVKVHQFNEYFLPLTQVIAMHLAPPLADPLDYEENESNRRMAPITGMVAGFTFKGEIRISTQGDLKGSLELAKMQWLSLYNLEVSSAFMPQMPVMKVGMALVSPTNVHFGENY